jgi:threonylcarbamoyladenosine tRNA methylthiotransferase MtaB
MKYAVVTFGCRVNQADSLVIEQQLQSRGAVHTSPNEADLLVVNTCSVTAGADQGARQTIRRVVRANPAVQVVVTGCYATRRPEEVGALPNVAAVVTNSYKDTLVDEISAAIGLSTAARFGGGEGACGAPFQPGMAGRTALTLRVQTGCEEQCSYCIIPMTRGVSRSKSPDEVMGDVCRAVDAGYKEIWITGVHLGSYGRDLHDAICLRDLLARVAAVPEDVLFRVSSLEPMDCTPDIVDLVASSPRLAPHFHLPLQHGSDDMLRAMRRPYTVRYYRDLVTRIHRLMPHAAIGSDVIVGFPGEEQRHFDELRSLLADLPLAYLHVFPYSDRPGTDASRHPAKVDGVAIRQRGAEIRAIGTTMAMRFRRSQTGTIRRALTVDAGSCAVTDNYLKVELGQTRPRNSWVNVTI